MGANGAGKTTLLRTILGEIEPLSGTVTLGHNVQTGHLDQGTWSLPDEKTVLDAFLEVRKHPDQRGPGPPGALPVPGRGCVQAGECAFRWRADAPLARAAADHLSQRTGAGRAYDTHLDIPSREALEAALESFDGALLFVSHDRHFIGLMAERILVIEDGAARLFEGGFEEWMRANRPPEPEPVSRRARARHRRRDREARRRERLALSASQAETVDYEALIQRLEANVSDIEQRLDAATADRNVDEIARLGRDHTRAQKGGGGRLGAVG